MDAPVDNDPLALLQYDPTSVAILASRDTETFEEVAKFALDITRFVDMIRTVKLAGVSTDNDRKREFAELDDNPEADERNHQQRTVVAVAANDVASTLSPGGARALGAVSPVAVATNRVDLAFSPEGAGALVTLSPIAAAADNFIDSTFSPGGARALGAVSPGAVATNRVDLTFSSGGARAVATVSPVAAAAANRADSTFSRGGPRAFGAVSRVAAAANRFDSTFSRGGARAFGAISRVAVATNYIDLTLSPGGPRALGAVSPVAVATNYIDLTLSPGGALTAGAVSPVAVTANRVVSSFSPGGVRALTAGAVSPDGHARTPETSATDVLPDDESKSSETPQFAESGVSYRPYAKLPENSTALLPDEVSKQCETPPLSETDVSCRAYPTMSETATSLCETPPLEETNVSYHSYLIMPETATTFLPDEVDNEDVTPPLAEAGEARNPYTLIGRYGASTNTHQQNGVWGLQAASNVAPTVRHPRRLVPGSNGTLQKSNLRRSIGLTRHDLNKHRAQLGLSACFAIGVVSSRGGTVSHLTLNHKWNDLPVNEEETLEWWLGDGPGRLKLSKRLDPSEHHQQEDGIPIFFACDQVGGALCYYVGHYRCIRFELNNVIFKKKPRQALLEFQFAAFSESLSEKMTQILGR